MEINFEEANKFQLIGNPYPSAINADLFLSKNEFKTKGALYFWTHNTPIANREYTSDDYAVYNLVGGVGTKAVSNGINETVPDGKIGSGQAFFVKSNQTGKIEFSCSMRIPEKNNTFFKPAALETNENKTETEKHRLWLNLKNEKGAFKQILVGYLPKATNNFDINYDAESFNGNSYVDFYSICDSKKLVIQGRALPFEENDEIILGYKTVIAESFIIAIDHADGDLKNQTIYLEDKLTNNISDLTSKDYTFNSEIGTFTDRFVLRFENKKLNTDHFNETKDEVWISVKNKIITIKSESTVLNSIMIYNINGEMIYEKNKLDDTQFEISNLKSADNVLLIKTNLKDGRSIVKKVIF